jgi:oxygen-dependent protoporphyrinogen oxidase
MAETRLSRKRVAVVGGGIAGLAAAHRLVELSRESNRPVDVILLEAAGRLGGVIHTERTDGFVIEAGPDSFLTERPWALALSERIGLTPRLIGTRGENRKTYVVHDGRLHSLPDGFLLMAPTRFLPLVQSRLFSWPGKLRMAADLVLPRGAERSDESLAHFVTRRLGREALERVVQPLIGGIYTADPAELSLAATMPRFLEMEKEKRSVIWSMWTDRRRAGDTPGERSGARWSLFASFDDGMQTLVDTLAQRLPEGVVRLGRSVCSVEHDDTWRIGTEVGENIEADALILAVPAHQGARLLRGIDKELADELAEIRYASSAIVTLAFDEKQIGKPLDGFGFVVPHIEGRSILACSYSSVKYEGRAPNGRILLRCFVGGALQPEVLNRDDAELIAGVRRELAELLGLRGEPTLTRVARWNQAMPQYRVGHLDKLRRVDQLLRRRASLFLAGSAYRGVGIPHCINSGEDAAERLFAYWSSSS